MLAEMMAPVMIKRGLRGVRFTRFEPQFSSDLNGIGWYIHMPFCRRMCTYCCFRSLHYAPEKVRPYVEAVKKEIAIYRERLGRVRAGDLYFGGGTPSLTVNEVVEIADYFRQRFDLGGEIGMEVNPEDVSPQMCAALREAGITKLSVGVQSFNADILRVMQRNYDAGHVLRAIALLLDHGFNVSIDLLYALPGQTLGSLMEDMKIAAETGVHQISAYPLMLFPFTKLSHQVKGGMLTVPPAGMERKMFYAVSDYLTGNGYAQISCWDYINRNRSGGAYITCTRDENIGVGLSAYTKLGQLFYVNTFHLRSYIEGVGRGLPIATGTIMPERRVMRRYFMMGLFQLGVAKAEFEKRFGTSIGQALGSLPLMLKLFGIVREHPDRFTVTRNGMYWASLMTKASMLNFPGRYYQECLHRPWPDDFEM
ncbi:MAG: coproporphyrinogen III oxidase family protein [Dehalococcoidales bacterium]|nr:coproporphyrinogen III oxidase family protein [Dehalococcoidales bacterium]